MSNINNTLKSIIQESLLRIGKFKLGHAIELEYDDNGNIKKSNNLQKIIFDSITKLSQFKLGIPLKTDSDKDSAAVSMIQNTNAILNQNANEATKAAKIKVEAAEAEANKIKDDKAAEAAEAEANKIKDDKAAKIKATFNPTSANTKATFNPTATSADSNATFNPTATSADSNATFNTTAAADLNTSATKVADLDTTVATSDKVANANNLGDPFTDKLEDGLSLYDFIIQLLGSYARELYVKDVDEFENFKNKIFLNINEKTISDEFENNNTLLFKLFEDSDEGNVNYNFFIDIDFTDKMDIDTKINIYYLATLLWMHVILLISKDDYVDEGLSTFLIILAGLVMKIQPSDDELFS